MVIQATVGYILYYSFSTAGELIKMPEPRSEDPNVIREIKDNPVRDVSVVGLFDDGGRLLLARTQRLPHHWQLIGGGVRSDDLNPTATVQRELKEETNLYLPLEAFNLQFVADYDFGKGKVFFFTARLPRKAILEFDSSEIIDWRWFKWDGIKELNLLPGTREFVIFLERTKEKLKP